MQQSNSSRSTMYRCRCSNRDREVRIRSSFESSNSDKLEIKLNFHDTREIWNWIPDQDSTLQLGPITRKTREREAPSFLVEKSWSRQDLREAIGKSIGNFPYTTEILTDHARERLREILKAEDDDSKPSYGILRITRYTYVRHHHVYGSEVIGGMVPAAESSFHLLEKCEDGGGGEGNECSICLDGFAGKGLLRMPCSHVFHGGCIEKWLRRSHNCPLCRYQMPTE